jgi:hypothetical protein
MAYPVASASFTVPCTIDTYGNAWNGTLAFGLFHYNPSNSARILESYLVFMNTDGELLSFLEYNDAEGYYGIVKNIGNDTLMYQGEPDTTTHFWNFETNQTTDFPDVNTYHHDIDHDPFTGNFLCLRNYVRNVNGTEVLFDTIVELNSTGGVLWTWDTYDYLPLSYADPLNDTATVNGTTAIDFTHCNTIQWDYAENVVYLNSRHLDTFFKINMTTGNIIWACGLHGNFTLLDASGDKVSSLWYGSHDLEEVQPDVFMMFDNDFHNLTNPDDANSRMLEITLNEQNMTAQETWSWEAPQEYWSPYWGEADILPNGDRIGTFGTLTKQYNSSIGAVLVEVNQTGQIVRTWTFPTYWGIYRAIVEVPAEWQNTVSEFNPTPVTVAVVVIAAALIICVVVLRVKKRPSTEASGAQDSS